MNDCVKLTIDLRYFLWCFGSIFLQSDADAINDQTYLIYKCWMNKHNRRWFCQRLLAEAGWCLRLYYSHCSANGRIAICEIFCNAKQNIHSISIQFIHMVVVVGIFKPTLSVANVCKSATVKRRQLINFPLKWKRDISILVQSHNFAGFNVERKRNI